MEIHKNILTDILDRDTFVRAFQRFAVDVLRECRLFPTLAILRVREAHGAWVEDLTRVGSHERHLEEGLDHFKQCGHLAFWLRRMSPLVEAVDTTENIADAPGWPLRDEEQQLRKLLFGYGNELLAFDFGFQICKFYETGEGGDPVRIESLVPDMNYHRVICHFLKYKTVSPHAMHLIYRSLFYRQGS